VFVSENPATAVDNIPFTRQRTWYHKATDAGRLNYLILRIVCSRCRIMSSAWHLSKQAHPIGRLIGRKEGRTDGRTDAARCKSSTIVETSLWQRKNGQKNKQRSGFAEHRQPDIQTAPERRRQIAASTRSSTSSTLLLLLLLPQHLHRSHRADRSHAGQIK